MEKVGDKKVKIGENKTLRKVAEGENEPVSNMASRGVPGRYMLSQEKDPAKSGV